MLIKDLIAKHRQPEQNWLSSIASGTGIDQSSLLPQDLSPDQLYGENFDFLSGKAKDIVGGGLDPVLADLMGIYKRDISEYGDTTRRNIDTRLASSGFRGAGANLINDTFKTQSNALTTAENSVGQLGLQNKQFYSNLLNNLNQFQGGQNFANEQYRLGGTQGAAGLGLNYKDMKLREEQLKLERQKYEDSQGFDFGNFIGNLVNPAATVLAASKFVTSDKKMKKEIKDTGMKTESGLPIKTFKYRGDKSGRTFIGHLADQVEKKFPDAVFKVIDYNKIPDGIFAEVN